ncbi:MAG: CBS domain-containing protein [Pseudomonadota bacterium]
MENYTVKDLMVPISEYATVSEDATLYDAVMALEKAQEEFDHNKYRHRAVLILNHKKHVIGKLSQLDVLRAIEPRDAKIDEIDDISRFGFSEPFINAMREKYRLTGPLIKNALDTAMKIKVIDCMQAPSEGEYVGETASLDTAIHQLVMGTHLSLLVTRKNEIVGILRMSDVFAAVFHAMKQSEKKE